MENNQRQHSGGGDRKTEKPPVHKVPDKDEVPKKPEPKENPSGNKDNKPEEQSSG